MGYISEAAIGKLGAGTLYSNENRNGFKRECLTKSLQEFSGLALDA
jgi:hypothetical protein